MIRNLNNELRLSLKKKLSDKSRPLFVGWISFAHPSITEIFSNINLDFNVIDMEHSTINIEQTAIVGRKTKKGGDVLRCRGTLLANQPIPHRHQKSMQDQEVAYESRALGVAQDAQKPLDAGQQPSLKGNGQHHELSFPDKPRKSGPLGQTTRGFQTT